MTHENYPQQPEENDPRWPQPQVPPPRAEQRYPHQQPFPKEEGHKGLLQFIGSLPERVRRKEPFACILVGTLAAGLFYGVGKTALDTIENAHRREQSQFAPSEYIPCKDGSVQPPDLGCANNGGDSTFTK